MPTKKKDVQKKTEPVLVLDWLAIGIAVEKEIKDKGITKDTIYSKYAVLMGIITKKVTIPIRNKLKDGSM